MQVVTPIDVEDALRIDLADIMYPVRCYAPPPPNPVQAGDLMVTRTGGAPVTPVTHEHDVSVDVWAATDAEAVALANEACAAVNSLPIRDTGTEWKRASALLPYLNPDPDRPHLSRATLTATLTCRGTTIDF